MKSVKSTFNEMVNKKGTERNTFNTDQISKLGLHNRLNSMIIILPLQDSVTIQ